MKKFLFGTFLFTWIVEIIVLYSGIDGILRAVLLPLAALGPGVGAFLFLQTNDGLKTDYKLILLPLTLIALSYLLIIFRPDFIENERAFSLLKTNVWAIMIVVFNIVLGGFLANKSNLFKNVSLRDVLIGILFFPAILIIINIVGFLLWGTPLKTNVLLRELPLNEYLIVVLMTIPFTIFIQGGIEELGWRPMFQTELQRKFNPLVASIFTGIVWGIWHFPLYLIRGEELNTLAIISRIAQSVLLSILLIYFFNKSKSTLQSVLLHGMSNACLLLLPIHGLLWWGSLLLCAIYFIWNGKMWKRSV